MSRPITSTCGQGTRSRRRCAFDGTLIIVSHDRYFIDRIAATVVVCENSCWKCFSGNYSDYVRFYEQRKAEVEHRESSRGRAQTGTSARSRRASHAPQRQFSYRKTEDIERKSPTKRPPSANSKRK